jgi:hypothetical protein
LSNNVLIENFGPTICSTLRKELAKATGRACTPPTLPVLLSSEPVSSLGLAIPCVTPPPFQANQAEVEESKHEQKLFNEGAIAMKIQNPTICNNGDEATFTNLPQASISVKNLSRKPQPWHLVKKLCIVPDGLVQARLTHFLQLTNLGRGHIMESKRVLGSTKGKAEKLKVGILNSPGASKQRKY